MKRAFEQGRRPSSLLPRKKKKNTDSRDEGERFKKDYSDKTPNGLAATQK
jgi:hypothetical protein